MDYSGINLGSVKNINRSGILKLLNSRGAMSRKDVAHELGLTPAAVTMICNDLLEKDIIVEKGEADETEKRAGRKKILIGINYNLKKIICINIEELETNISICNLKGECRGTTSIHTRTDVSPKFFVSEVCSAAKELVIKMNVSKEDILGVGVTVPGRVDKENGISLHAYRIWDEEVKLRQIIEEQMSFPVVVDNSVIALAEAELMFGAGKDNSNIFFLKWGPGLGGAVSISDSIFAGQRIKSCEIGHVIVDKNGEECRCSSKGCLETFVSTHGIAYAIRNVCSPEDTPILWKWSKGRLNNIRASNISDWSVLADKKIGDEFLRLIDILAQSIVNAITVLAPKKVIVYGNLFKLQNFKKEFIRACSYYNASFDENFICESELSAGVSFIGPAAIVAKELFFC